MNIRKGEDTNKRFWSLGVLLVLALVGSGPLLQAQTDYVSDLDQLTPQDLEQLLIWEIDDIFDRVDPNGIYPDTDLEYVIIEALKDEGDDDYEDDLDYDELEQEMGEQGTSVEQVVHDAVLNADALSYRQESPSSTFVHVGRGLLVQNRRGTARGGTAFCQSVQTLVTVSVGPYRSRCRY